MEADEIATEAQILKEMHERVTAVVHWMLMGVNNKKDAITKTARFLGITISQTKCFVYEQATRVDAYVADRIRVRTNQELYELAKAAYAYEEARSKLLGVPARNMMSWLVPSSKSLPIDHKWISHEVDPLAVTENTALTLRIISEHMSKGVNALESILNTSLTKDVNVGDRSLIIRLMDGFNDGVYCYTGDGIGEKVTLNETGMTIRESPGTGDANTLLEHIRLTMIRQKPVIFNITGVAGMVDKPWQWTRVGIPIPGRNNQILHVITEQEEA